MIDRINVTSLIVNLPSLFASAFFKWNGFSSGPVAVGSAISVSTAVTSEMLTFPSSFASPRSLIPVTSSAANVEHAIPKNNALIIKNFFMVVSLFLFCPLLNARRGAEIFKE